MMFQCLFCPSQSALVEPYKAPVLEIVCSEDEYDVVYKEIPDIEKSNSTSTEETMCSASTDSHHDEIRMQALQEPDSMEVAMRASTPSNHLLEIFLSQSSISWTSPKSATSYDDDEDVSAAPSVHLGKDPVLSSPSLEISMIEESEYDEDKEEDPIRMIRIQQELDDIMKFAEELLGVEFIEDEAIEAIGIAANQVVSDTMSIGNSIVNGNLLELAEEHYFGDSNSFLTRYAAVLRSTVRQMKSNSIQEQKYYDGPNFEYVRFGLAKRNNKLMTLAQNVARGSWKSAGSWVYKKMARKPTSQS